MTPELTALTLAALLQVVQFTLHSVTANHQVGPKTALGPRDAPVHLTDLARRARRATDTHFKGRLLSPFASMAISGRTASPAESCARPIPRPMPSAHPPARHPLGRRTRGRDDQVSGRPPMIFFLLKISRGRPRVAPGAGGSAPSPLTTKDPSHGKL